MVEQFEQAVAEILGAKNAVAVSSGTAALHAAVFAAGIGPQDEVILPPMTFVATANAVVFEGGTPVFADVVSDTLLIDPKEVAKKITSKTKAIIAVDYAGHPAEYDELRALADDNNLVLIVDACHSLGATYKGKTSPQLADISVYSFHPVKHITTGEGGMVVTDNREFALAMTQFRNHGINADHKQRARQNSFHYDMEKLGYNYRVTDIQCALGLSQIKKLSFWIKRRKEIAERYNEGFHDVKGVLPLRVRDYVGHAYHLYVVRLDTRALGITRDKCFSDLRDAGIGVNVHYMPVHLHSYYKEKYGTQKGICPRAEAGFEEILTLPCYPKMVDAQVDTVISEVTRVLERRG